LSESGFSELEDFQDEFLSNIEKLSESGFSEFEDFQDEFLSN
jgi:hypothetical protein